ncbi:MAG: DUF4058 family protein [Chloroflexota bacterium]|nr:DUF4058 family protein [Chloroflexota bacterium]
MSADDALPPIQSRQNLYGTPDKPAINAHLHSVLQNKYSGWESFHGSLIQEFGAAIQAQLDVVYPNRYAVEPTLSLQLRDHASERPKKRSFVPDASIFERQRPSVGAAAITIPEPTLNLDGFDTILEEDYLTAMQIFVSGDVDFGDSVTWIEILSAVNKVGGSGYAQYRQKRAAALRQGKSLVEFDFLHETESPIISVPSYPDREPGATAYYAAITDKRSQAELTFKDRTLVYGFGVDVSMPTVYVPLKDADLIRFNFGAAYNAAFSRFAAFGDRVDYRQLPPNIESYTPDDQAAIRARMAALAAAQP